MSGGGGGGGPSEAQKKLTQLQLEEFAKLKETEKRQKAVLNRRRSSANDLFSGSYAGIPAPKQSLSSL